MPEFSALKLSENDYSPALRDSIYHQDSLCDILMSLNHPKPAEKQKNTLETDLLRMETNETMWESETLDAMELVRIRSETAKKYSISVRDSKHLI